jgi:hypothetical protein
MGLCQLNELSSGFAMKEYDLISIGTGSAMHVVDAMLQTNPNLRVAAINKDEPGGVLHHTRVHAFKASPQSGRDGKDNRKSK